MRDFKNLSTKTKAIVILSLGFTLVSILTLFAGAMFFPLWLWSQIPGSGIIVKEVMPQGFIYFLTIFPVIMLIDLLFEIFAKGPLLYVIIRPNLKDPEKLDQFMRRLPNDGPALGWLVDVAAALLATIPSGWLAATISSQFPLVSVSFFGGMVYAFSILFILYGGFILGKRFDPRN